MSVPLSEIQDDYVRRVERERRAREDELLVLLIALLGTARRQTTWAVLHGFDFAAVIRNVVTGTANHRGAWRDIARTMAQAHRDGYRRIGLAAGTTAVERSQAGSLASLVVLYEGVAREAARAMAETLTQRVYEALRDRTPDVTLRETIRQAFDAGGYTPDNPYAVDLATERAVVTSHSFGGMAAIHERPELQVTGIAHVSIIDGRETDICHERHNLMLPVDHPYWLRNVPQLHHRCRSCLRPLFGDFTPTATLPVTQPMPGFGMNPLPAFARAA